VKGPEGVGGSALVDCLLSITRPCRVPRALEPVHADAVHAQPFGSQRVLDGQAGESYTHPLLGLT
jgi:hypothetical protein